MSSKAREALLAVYDCAKDGVLTIRESAFEKVLGALEESVRNCDVGTVAEQIKRYEDYCRAHTKLGGCTGCPLIQYRRCQIGWAQTPYKEGSDK